jgi:hypothetical protein
MRQGLIPDHKGYRGNPDYEGLGIKGVYGSGGMLSGESNVLDDWNQLKNPFADRNYKSKAYQNLIKRSQKDARQNYMDQIEDSLSQDGSRTIAEPGREERGLGIDVQHGQFPIYPEGQEDSAYKKPREAPGNAVSNIINNLVKSVGGSATNLGADLQRYMKTNLAQTTPNVIKDKLYGDAAFDGRAQFDTQEKTPSTPAYGIEVPTPYDPSVKYDIDFGNVELQPEISTGGMNQPMDLADFPDDEDTAKQSSSAELENARKLAQMYANRMGRRVSKAPTPTPTSVPPKDQEIILTKDKSTMDQNNLDKLFLRLYGAEKFNTMSPKQRNLMLMQYNQSKVKR